MNDSQCDGTGPVPASTPCFTSGEDFLAVAKAMPDPMFIISGTGRILDVLGGDTPGGGRAEDSPDASRPMVRLKGRLLEDILPTDAAAHYLDLIRDCLHGGGPKTFEFRLSPDTLLDHNAPRGTTPKTLPDDVSDASPDTGHGACGCQWYEARVHALPKRADRPDAVIWITFNITQRKQLIDKLSDLCVRDSLTGLYNRRYFINVFEKQFDIARRYGQGLSLLLMDLDFFKRINDTFGHAAGDSALKGFADNCLPMFRKADIFARFGGEEFVALLPNTDLKGAGILAERLCRSVAANVVDIGGLGIEMTVSIGVATLRPDDDTVDEIMARADHALYQAKEEGRDRICLFKDVESTPQ